MKKSLCAVNYMILLLSMITPINSYSAETGISVINKGIGGNNTEDALKRMKKDVLDLKPAYLIIYLGINDAVNSANLVAIEKYEANLQKMIDIAKQNGIENIILVTLNPVIERYVKKRHPNHPAENLNEHLAKYNDTILKVAALNKIPVADLRNLIETNGGATEENSSLLRNVANSKAEDGVHLTPEAYHKMAELFVPIFKNRIKNGDVVICFGDSITCGVHVKGSGTADGETYPAQLSLILNNMLKDLPNSPIRT